MLHFKVDSGTDKTTTEGTTGLAPRFRLADVNAGSGAVSPDVGGGGAERISATALFGEHETRFPSRRPVAYRRAPRRAALEAPTRALPAPCLAETRRTQASADPAASGHRPPPCADEARRFWRWSGCSRPVRRAVHAWRSQAGAALKAQNPESAPNVRSLCGIGTFSGVTAPGSSHGRQAVNPVTAAMFRPPPPGREIAPPRPWVRPGAARLARPALRPGRPRDGRRFSRAPARQARRNPAVRDPRGALQRGDVGARRGRTLRAHVDSSIAFRCSRINANASRSAWCPWTDEPATPAPPA